MPKIMPTTEYITLPFPREFVNIKASSYCGNIWPEILIIHTPETMNSLLNSQIKDKNSKVRLIQDLDRLSVSFNNNKAANFDFNETTDPELYFKFLTHYARSSADGTTAMYLTTDQMKVLISYFVVLNDQWLQNGAFAITYLTFNTLLAKKNLAPSHTGMQTESTITEKMDSAGNPYHILGVKRTGNIFNAGETQDTNGNLQPLFICENNIKVSLKNENEIPQYIDHPDDVKIEKNCWINTIIPAFRNALKKSHMCFSSDDIYHYIPFLLDKALARDFFRALTQAHDYYNDSDNEKSDLKIENYTYQVRLYVEICYKDLPEVKARILSQLKFAENLRDFRKNKSDLKELIGDTDYPRIQRKAARKILKEINALPMAMRHKNIETVNLLLTSAATAIRTPDDAANIVNLHNTASTLAAVSWSRRIGRAAVVLVAATIMTVSILAAVASFGASGVFSAMGIAISVSLITQALAISSASLAAVGVIGAASVKLSPYKDLHTSALLFKKPKSTKQQQVMPEEDRVVENKELREPLLLDYSVEDGFISDNFPRSATVSTDDSSPSSSPTPF